MAATTSNQLIEAMEPCGLRPVPVAASTNIYQGTMVFSASGYGSGTAGGASFLGVALEQQDNSSGSAGDLNAECYTRGAFSFNGTSFTQATVGVKIYATDNNTVTATATSNSFVGKCVEYISATKIRVELETVSD